MLSRLCPRCGKQEDAEEFIGSFCKTCFLATQTLYFLPKTHLIFCPKCERFRLGGEWKSASTLSGFLQQKIRSAYPVVLTLDDFHIEKNHLVGNLRLEINVYGSLVLLSAPIRCDVQKQPCPSCGLQSGGYHQAVLQVRGSASQVQQKTNSLVRKLERKTFITKIVQQENGLDVWIGEKKPLFELLKGERYTLSHKLVGEKHGKRLYRVSVCIRV